MNLSTERGKREIKIQDRRFEGETYEHFLSAYTSQQRIEYSRAVAIAAGPAIMDAAMKDKDAAVIHGADTIVSAQEAATVLYDQLIEKVTGYTANDEQGEEVDAMTMCNWKDLIPSEHKNAVIMELLPQPSVVKN